MRYLVIGGTGSLGKKLIERLLPKYAIWVYSRDEAKHFTIRNEFSQHPNIKRLRFIVGDIRDQHRVREAIDQIEPAVIIIAAALKQVDTCELSPSESIATNLTGTQNVISAVVSYNMMHGGKIEKVLFVSTDKACAPVNVYGMCKATSERIVSSRAAYGMGGTQFLCTRYGNVLESRGSIIPLFKYQAMHNESLTVTDPDMTRFLMTLDDSVDLIEHTLKNGKCGETWVPKIPAMRIGDLAEIFAQASNKTIKVIGLRPGEKKHEDLINESESVRTRDVNTHYVIQDAATSTSNGVRFTYSSNDNVMSKDELHRHLTKLGIIDASLESFHGLNIEEIATNRK